IIEYVPVHADERNVLADAPMLVAHAEARRRAGINLVTLALHALRANGVIDRVRLAPFSGIHALLDAVGDAPIEPDDTGDVRIALPDGADGTVNLRLDELPLTTAAATDSRSWRGGHRNP